MKSLYLAEAIIQGLLALIALFYSISIIFFHVTLFLPAIYSIYTLLAWQELSSLLQLFFRKYFFDKYLRVLQNTLLIYTALILLIMLLERYAFLRTESGSSIVNAAYLSLYLFLPVLMLAIAILTVRRGVIMLKRKKASSDM